LKIPTTVGLFLNNGQDLVFTQDEMFLAVDLDFVSSILGKENPVVLLDVHGDPFAVVIALPSAGFSVADWGMMIPPAVFSSTSTRLINTRSNNGLTFMK
jgi:hypothetical protein